MTFLQLLSPCLFGHGEMLRTRDDEGHFALQCEDCGKTTRVFERPAIKGPRHHAAPVKGAPSYAVKRVFTISRPSTPLRAGRYPRSA